MYVCMIVLDVGNASHAVGSTASFGGHPGRMGYQGSRRVAYRGRGGVAGHAYNAGRGRYTQYSQAAVHYPCMEFGMIKSCNLGVYMMLKFTS